MICVTGIPSPIVDSRSSGGSSDRSGRYGGNCTHVGGTKDCGFRIGPVGIGVGKVFHPSTVPLPDMRGYMIMDGGVSICMCISCMMMMTIVTINSSTSRTDIKVRNMLLCGIILFL